ncbi:TfoX/Sxy family protein [Dyella sp. 20L07]|uniref:TfoX/Sxy family protein n=1 Tax=Dyella sp. 20L07 TaxID=3384240 RepID=UPI003D2993F2
MNAGIEALRRDLQDAATHLGRPHDLRFKPMFGGLMAYFDEKPCAWLSTQGLALKLAVVDQAALLAHQGAVRFRHRPDAAPSRGYVIVPPALCGDTATLADWLLRSATVAPSQKRPRPKTRP